MPTLKIYTYNLPLKHPFVISRRSFEVQTGIIVEISDGKNSGYGEATYNPYYLNTEPQKMAQIIASALEQTTINPLEAPFQNWEHLLKSMSNHRFALCALDVALWDFYSKVKGMTLRKLWGFPDQPSTQTSYTLSLEDIPTTIERIKENKYPIYKVKLGIGDDLQRLRAIREVTEAELWVDVNGAWSLNQAIEMSHELKVLGIRFIEQPMPYDHWEAMQQLYEASALPIIADESCRLPEDVAKCASCFHGINIKVMKAGGLTPTLSMLKEAEKLGLKKMIGCMTESTIGISAIAQFSPVLDFADMDGPLFLKEDIASGVHISNGDLILNKESGAGSKLFKPLEIIFQSSL